MAAGWNLKNGDITEYNVSEDRLWALFNYVFSDSSRKRNTYKFGLIKSILDNLFNGEKSSEGIYYTYEEIFAKFAENYWNLVVKYNLKQMRPDGKSIYSKVETIIKNEISKDDILCSLDFSSMKEEQKNRIVKQVVTECKKCVIGALYNDFEGVIYSFDLKGTGITLNYCVHEFLLKHKMELEKLNYYAWARFLESVNDDNVLVRVIDKLELSTPRRNNLHIYREILRREFEENNCFYCGRKLKQEIHVDHFIPWSFVKDDKIWNFVLACSSCNTRKNNKLPREEYLIQIIHRNRNIQQIDNSIVRKECTRYSDEVLRRMWAYARRSGFKEFEYTVTR